MSKYIPAVLWSLISARGLWTWRHNANQMKRSLAALRANGQEKLPMLFARADQLMDNLRALAFLNGLIVGLLSFVVTAKVAWFVTSPLLMRLFADYTLAVLIGAFFLFMVNGEIYAYVLDRVHGTN